MSATKYSTPATRLWWVSLRGQARVLDTGEEAERALRMLVDKYEQYRREPPGRPVLGVDISAAQLGRLSTGAERVRRSGTAGTQTYPTPPA